MTFSKNQVRKLGRALKETSQDKNEDLLIKLQEYRKSFHEIAQTVFLKLKELSERNSNGLNVSSYRIKRIESILSKLERFPTMKLDTMWDICGCRCVLENEEQVNSLRNLLVENFDIRREVNYLETPKSDGYRAIHLYVSLPENKKDIIEIQLRSIKFHNWATFVEIIDLLYKTKIKEGENHPHFNNLHKLLSIDINALDYAQKREIIQIEDKYAIIQNLSDIFNKNYFKVRSQWLSIEKDINKKFFVFSVGEDLAPQILSFANILEAENKYYEIFSKKSQNVLLAHLNKPDFSQIKIAYSNYVLTKNQFIYEWIEILTFCIQVAMDNEDKKSLKLYAELFDKNTSLHLKNIKSELTFIKKIKDKEYPQAKINEWISELEDMVRINNNKGERLIEIARKFNEKSKSNDSPSS